MEQKTISIITPVFNREDCIEMCLTSVAMQQIPEGWYMEHVIVDDGSTDGTYGRILEFKDTYKHIGVWHFNENRGTNAARNEAICRAKGKWIVLLDSDDRMLPGSVITICQTIENYPDFKHFLFLTDDTVSKRKKLGETVTFSFEDFLWDRINGDFVHVFLRQVALDFPFNEKLRIHEWIFFLKYFKVAEKIKFFSTVLFERDRKRHDHVTRMLDLYRDSALESKLNAQKLGIALFGDDYMKTDEGHQILIRRLKSVYLLSIFANDYKVAADYRLQLHDLSSGISSFQLLLEKTKTGGYAWGIVKILVRLKHWLKDK